MTNALTPTLLILGKGEIARCLVQLASTLSTNIATNIASTDAATTELSIMVSEPGAATMAWPHAVQVRESIYADAPWPLAANSHAVIARGHEGDPASVAALLNEGAKHVYLIASARRAQEVIAHATPMLIESKSLDRLSAPAGLDLGGDSSMEIALSILAEIQMRHYARSGQALGEMRETRAREVRRDVNERQHSTDSCPGKRA